MADHKSAQERPAGKREAVDHVEIGDATGAFLRAGRLIEKIKSLALFFSMIRLRSIPGIDRSSLRNAQA